MTIDSTQTVPTDAQRAPVRVAEHSATAVRPKGYHGRHRRPRNAG